MPPIAPSRLWTGSLNEAVVGASTGSTVGLYDTTLRDGEQSVGVVFTPDQKLEIARLLDDLGVDRIEAGFPRVSDEDYRALGTIARAGLRAEIWGSSRALVDDVKALVEIGLPAAVIEAPVSTLKLDALGVSRETVLTRIADSIAFAVTHGIRIAFFGVDGSRADLRVLEAAYKTARDAGAAEFVVVDTLGIATPEAAAYLVGQVRGWVGLDAPLHFHGHNDFGLATAATVAAVRAGATWVHGTVDGIGERAGNADLAQVALALGALYHVETNLRLDRVRAMSRRLRAIAGYQLEPWKCVVGDNLFVRETGAVAAQFHVPQAIEPYSSELLATPRAIVLGKRSGVASIRIKCKELALDVPEERYAGLLSLVKSFAVAKRGLLTDEEFRTLVERDRASQKEGTA